jgi:CDP-glucose 4,6-dehydratase
MLDLRDHAFWRDRPVLVTGGSGLLGGWLVQRLIELKANIVCIVRDWPPDSFFIRAGDLSRVSVVHGDITDLQLVERALGEYEVETVFHLAAQTIVGIANRNPLSTFESNIRGTWTMLEACRRSPKVKQIISASSDKAYGDQDTLPYRESSPLQGRHPYDVSKSCADLICTTYATTYGTPVTITRCGNFYGGGDMNWSRIVPGTIRSVVRGEKPIIRSDGKFIRDYFFVKDGVEAYLLLAEKMESNPKIAGEAFNFSNEIQVTVIDLVEKILTKMDSPLKPDVRGEAGHEIKHQYLSAEKARTSLGWKPLFSIDEGLDITIQWYREFLGNV